MKKAFIIGNGISRKPVDLNKLVGKGTIFGCNALYREFDKYDYLVSIDKTFQTIIEANDDVFGKDERLIFPPPEECWEDAEYSPNRRRSNAGMNAMLEAIRRDHDKLYCLGFDFLLKDNELSEDNLFKNQLGYGPETHANHLDNKYRIAYLEWFMRKYSQTKFVFVLPDNQSFQPLSAPNVSGQFISKFIEKNC